jgi:hypothetical protein
VSRTSSREKKSVFSLENIPDALNGFDEFDGGISVYLAAQAIDVHVDDIA